MGKRKGGKGKSQIEDLEAEVFGGDDQVVDDLGKEETLIKNDNDIERSDDEEDVEGDDEEVVPVNEKEKKRPAWEDDDDDALTINISKKARLRKLRRTEEEETVTGAEYQERLRTQFRLLQKNSQSWAEKDHDDSAEEDEDIADAIARTTSKAVGSVSSTLPKGVLDVTRMKDANAQEISAAVVQSVDWHHNGELMLTAGFDKKVRLFQIDGAKNLPVQNVFLADLPIHTARFNPVGDEIIISGRRKYYYSYDLVAGRVDRVAGIQGREEKSWESFSVSPMGDEIAFLGNHGFTVLVDMRTKMWKGDVKMNAPVRAVSYSPCGKFLYTAGQCQDIYTWDLRTRRCLNRAVDEGSIYGMSMDVSANGQYLACGSDSGVVNVYNTADIAAERSPKPLKGIMSLVTPADGVKFNAMSNILMVRSAQKKEALRLVHLPSLTVFKNWPTANTPLQYVSSAAFSPNSGYLSVGNQKGKALLYRLNHFARA